MAVMARSLEIPARVAVGFLAPEQLQDGSFQYTSDDLHAWPEIYFGGSGWVRFEPTPSSPADGVITVEPDFLIGRTLAKNLVKTFPRPLVSLLVVIHEGGHFLVVDNRVTTQTIPSFFA